MNDIDEQCRYCEGRWDRPGLYGCEDAGHTRPTTAQRIVAAIEEELSGRRGFGWGPCTDEIAVEIRDRLAEIVDENLRELHGRR